MSVNLLLQALARVAKGRRYVSREDAPRAARAMTTVQFRDAWRNVERERGGRAPPGYATGGISRPGSNALRSRCFNLSSNCFNILSGNGVARFVPIQRLSAHFMAPNENIERAQCRREINEVRENDPRRRHQTLAQPIDRRRKDHSLDEPVDEQDDIDEEHSRRVGSSIA